MSWRDWWVFLHGVYLFYFIFLKFSRMFFSVFFQFPTDLKGEIGAGFVVLASCPMIQHFCEHIDQISQSQSLQSVHPFDVFHFRTRLSNFSTISNTIRSYIVQTPSAIYRWN